MRLLVRLCMEKNRLTELDLNPVAKSLLDLRAAVQHTGRLALAPLSQPLAVLYHFCVRDQTVTGHPSSEQLPACEELWNWNTGQTGTYPTPQRARSVMSRANQYTSADLAGPWTGEQGGELDLEGNKLTGVTLTGLHVAADNQAALELAFHHRRGRCAGRSGVLADEGGNAATRRKPAAHGCRFE